MREAELLNALAQHPAGIEVHLKPDAVTVATLYLPILRETRRTLFQAAWAVAHRMIQHPTPPPPQVRAALTEYDNATWGLQL